MRRPRPTRTRATRQGASGVSLFPFLAVLICTMGSLIVLLVVLARQARLQAAEAARAAAAKTAVDLDEIEAQRELARWQAAQLKESRTRTEAQMAEARLRLGSVEDHIRTLRDEIARLEAAWRELDQTAAGGVQKRGQLESEMARLKAELAVAEKQLADELKAAQDRQDSYAIIPYQGPNRTRRRPIYIECRADGIVLQPEGIVFTEEDFQGSLGPGNPLAAALRASREYLTAQQPPGPDGPDEPYPLLLVRPDGIAAYYAARAAMESWGSEFGYELIGENWKLKFHPPDAQFTRVVRHAVETARQRQQLLAEIAPRHAGIRNRPKYRAGVQGIVREGSTGDADEMPLPARPHRPALGGPEARPELTGRPRIGIQGDGSALPGNPGEAGGYAPQQHSREFASQFGSGTDRPPGTPTDGTRPAEAGAAPQGDRAEAQGGRAAVKPPEDYVPGRPTEQQASPGAGGTPLRPGEWEPSPPPSPKKPPVDFKVSAQGQPGKRTEGSLAGMRGRNWGLPDTSGGAIPITRPIRVDCYADRLVIAQDSKQGGRVVHLGPRTRNSVDELVSAVWDHMDTWGIAGRGMYWRPVLSVRVTPGAEDRYDDLNALLQESGLRVEKRKDEG